MTQARAAEPPGLNEALGQLERRGQFSGAVVVRGPEGVRFARGNVTFVMAREGTNWKIASWTYSGATPTPE